MANESLLSIHVINTSRYISCRFMDADESLRMCDNSFSWISSKGLQVKSFQYPEANSTAIYLIGSWKEMDNDIFTFFPRERVEDYLEKFLDTIKEFLKFKFESEVIDWVTDLGMGGKVIRFVKYDGLSPVKTQE